MHRYDQNAYTNDIVSQLGIQGVGFGGPGAFGAPFFNVQGYSPMGDNYSATPMKAWDTIAEGRDSLSWQHGRHSLKFGGSYRQLHLADVGILPEPRLLPVHQRLHHRQRHQRRHWLSTRQLPAGLAGREAAPGGHSADAASAVVCRRLRAGQLPRDSLRPPIEMGLRYEYMEPLVDISYTNSNLTFENGVPSAFIGGQNGFPRG